MYEGRVGTNFRAINMGQVITCKYRTKSLTKEVIQVLMILNDRFRNALIIKGRNIYHIFEEDTEHIHTHVHVLSFSFCIRESGYTLV